MVDGGGDDAPRGERRRAGAGARRSKSRGGDWKKERGEGQAFYRSRGAREVRGGSRQGGVGSRGGRGRPRAGGGGPRGGQKPRPHRALRRRARRIQRPPSLKTRPGSARRR